MWENSMVPIQVSGTGRYYWIMHCTLKENEMLKTNSNGKWTRIGNLYTNPQYIINAAEKVSAKLAKLGQGSSVRP